MNVCVHWLAPNERPYQVPGDTGENTDTSSGDPSLETIILVELFLVAERVNCFPFFIKQLYDLVLGTEEWGGTPEINAPGISLEISIGLVCVHTAVVVEVVYKKRLARRTCSRRGRELRLATRKGVYV